VDFISTFFICQKIVLYETRGEAAFYVLNPDGLSYTFPYSYSTTEKGFLMLLRIAGALAVMLGCAGLGLYYSSKEGFRIHELQELKKALLILSSEIEYMRAPLNIACANIAKRTELTISALFLQFSELLTTGEGETAYQLWATATDGLKGKTFMAVEDLSVIDGFGKTLGYLDKHMQQNAINYAVNYIDEKAAALQIQGDKNKRMYRSLGIICGLLITVVLW